MAGRPGRQRVKKEKTEAAMPTPVVSPKRNHGVMAPDVGSAVTVSATAGQGPGGERSCDAGPAPPHAGRFPPKLNYNPLTWVGFRRSRRRCSGPSPTRDWLTDPPKGYRDARRGRRREVGQLGDALDKRSNSRERPGDRNAAMTDSGPPNAAQVASSAYRLAALDQDFLIGDSTRGLRFQLEYQKAQEALRRLRRGFDAGRFRLGADSRKRPRPAGFWYAEARAFGRIASLEGGARAAGRRSRNVVATGGGPGTMEAANRGAYEAGAPTIGFNITLPREQEPNPYTTPALTFRFHYFAMRKMHFAMGAKALVVFPGGFGTFDELFELLTLCRPERRRACRSSCRRGLLAQGGRLGGAGQETAWSAREISA